MEKWKTRLGSWYPILKDELTKEYFRKLGKKISADRKLGVPVCPSPNRVFRSFQLTPFEKTKVCIVGTAPYDNPSYSDGLVFGLNEINCQPFPWELEVIHKAIEMDYMHGELPFISCFWHDFQYMAEQGVLLLPRLMTCQKNYIKAYKSWIKFTNKAIKALGERGEVVFMFWGQENFKLARQVRDKYKKNKVVVMVNNYPKTIADFPHKNMFTRANKVLSKFNKTPIEWAV